MMNKKNIVELTNNEICAVSGGNDITDYLDQHEWVKYGVYAAGAVLAAAVFIWGGPGGKGIGKRIWGRFRGATPVQPQPQPQAQAQPQANPEQV